MSNEASVYNSRLHLKTLGYFINVVCAIKVLVGLKTYLSSLAFKVVQEI